MSKLNDALLYIIDKAKDEAPELRAQLYDIAADLAVDDEDALVLAEAAIAIREAENAQYKLDLHIKGHRELENRKVNA